MVKLIKRVATLSSEKKYHLAQSSGPQPVIDTGDITCMTQILQGDSDTSRVGDQLTIRSIEYKFNAFLSTSATAPAVLRFLLIQWFPRVVNTASPPNIADNILFDGLTNSENYLQPYYHDNRNQFKVLLDKTVVVGLDAKVNPITYHGYITKGFRRRVQYYAGAFDDGNNQIFLIKLSNIATGSNPPSFTNYIKINYSDA